MAKKPAAKKVTSAAAKKAEKAASEASISQKEIDKLKRDLEALQNKEKENKKEIEANKKEMGALKKENAASEIAKRKLEQELKEKDQLVAKIQKEKEEHRGVNVQKEDEELDATVFINTRLPHLSQEVRSSITKLWKEKDFPSTGRASNLRFHFKAFRELPEMVAINEEEIHRAEGRPKRARSGDPSNPRANGDAEQLLEMLEDQGIDTSLHSATARRGYHLEVDTRAIQISIPLHRSAEIIHPVGARIQSYRRKELQPFTGLLDSHLFLSKENKVIKLSETLIGWIESPPDLLKFVWDEESPDTYKWREYVRPVAKSGGYSGPEARNVYEYLVRTVVMADGNKSLGYTLLDLQTQAGLLNKWIAELLSGRVCSTSYGSEMKSDILRAQQQQQQQQQHQQRVSAPRGAANTYQVGRPVVQIKKEERERFKGCWNCGSTDHLSNVCSKKKKYPPPFKYVN